MMSFTAEDGSHFYVPVDVQAASKVADEKRARNAGASARFRERRKAKEKEASTAISKLEQQNRELEREKRVLEHEKKEAEDQKEHYKEDRDRYRDIVRRTPGISHLASQGPPSPRESRPSQPYPPPASQQWESSTSGMDEIGRPSRRRRTEEQNDYPSYSYPNPASNIPPVQPSGYGPAGPRPTNLPPLRADDVAQHVAGGIPAPLPTTQASGRPAYDPYHTREYERKWPGEPGDGGGRK